LEEQRTLVDAARKLGGIATNGQSTIEPVEIVPLDTLLELLRVSWPEYRQAVRLTWPEGQSGCRCRPGRAALSLVVVLYLGAW
jgi:hypothetical protein